MSLERLPNQRSELTHYQTLQVDPAAEPSVIEAAYKALSRRYNPKVNSWPMAGELYERVRTAYLVVGDPNLRMAYDAQLGATIDQPLQRIVPIAEPRSPVDPLLARVKDRRFWIKYHAARGLHRAESQTCLQMLLAHLNDERCEMRADSAIILGVLNEARALQTLIAALTDSDALVRRCAAIALGSLGDRQATSQLVASLRDTNMSVRCAAVLALGRLRDPLAFSPLAISLQEKCAENVLPWENVRLAAARALASYGDPRAITPLLSALQDSPSSWRPTIAETLARLGSSMAVTTLGQCLSSDWDQLDQMRIAAAMVALGDVGAGSTLRRGLSVSSADEQGKESARAAEQWEAEPTALYLYLMGGDSAARVLALIAG